MFGIIKPLTGLMAGICQLLAILVIFIGVIKALIIFMKDVFSSSESIRDIQESRMELGHSFSLGLGFLIGASIVNTTVAPAWDDIGKLAAIIALRTALNYFLLREINIRTEPLNKKNE
ncbi:DUF1622 domain-containing protein [bacterium]|nr:DUF1622 domain-containing protein [bacterium]